MLIFTVDDFSLTHRHVSKALKPLDIETVACMSGMDCIQELKARTPDLFLLDIEMPGGNGFDLLEKFDEVNFNVIFTTAYDHYAIKAIEFSALGYLLKDTEINIIIDAIKTVHGGGALMDSSAMKVILNQFAKIPAATYDIDVLTDREKEICYIIAEGFNNKEISEKLFLGEGTVKNHITKVLQKLELRDRTQLAIYILNSK